MQVPEIAIVTSGYLGISASVPSDFSGNISGKIELARNVLCHCFQLDD